MSWEKNPDVIGNITCTQFQNTVDDELNPQNAYMYAPFIVDNAGKLTQEITFNNFDTLTRTETSDTKLLTATASSELPVSYESLDTSIATIINGDTLNAITTGTVWVRATQAGNELYDPATPVICIFTIVYDYHQVGPTGSLEFPTELNLYVDKPDVKTLSVVIDDIRYTQFSGISYGLLTGFRGVALMGTISATNGLDQPVTDFTSNPISVTVTMPNADPTHVYRIWQKVGSTLVDPQPNGYPVLLTYQSLSDWTGLMPFVGEFVIIDDTPPAGRAGGDPYIISVKKVKTLLPNEWKVINLLKTGTTQIIANCEFISSEVIDKLHYINKSKEVCLKIDPNLHKWVKDLTYITSIEFINTESGKKLVIDTLNGNIVSDDSSFVYETIKNTKYGLFSITHGAYYPHASFKQFIVYFDDGHLAISIDNYWDDINYIELFMNSEDYTSLSGELIEHSEENVIEKK